MRVYVGKAKKFECFFFLFSYSIVKHYFSTCEAQCDFFRILQVSVTRFGSKRSLLLKIKKVY